MRLTQSEISKLLTYNPNSGELFWKERLRELFNSDRAWKSWNTRYANRSALNLPHPKGYLQGKIRGQNYLAHRVIWKLVFDEEPLEIDHRDGIRSNNRLSNLFDVSHAENCQNASRRVDNNSGHTGVCWNRQYGKWMAYIGTPPNRTFLGNFISKTEEVSAYEREKHLRGYRPRHGQ